MQSATSNPGTWGSGGTTGDDLNTGVMSILDTRFAEPSAFSVSSSNVTLSYANVQTNILRFTGTLLANITVSPDTGGSPIAASYFNGVYAFENLTTGSFTITLQNATGGVVLPQGRRGLVYVSTINSLAPRILAGGNGDIAAGSKTLFYNTSAPTGWTAVALSDYAIKIVATGNGGVTSGSVAYSTLFGRTATDAHTLTTAQIPSHTHSIAHGSSGGGGSSNIAGGASGSTTSNTAATGGGDSHTHNLDMRVTTAAFVLATRD